MTMQKIPVGFFVTDAPRRFARGGLAQAAEKIRRAGRNGDTVVVHLSPGEFSWLRQNWGEPTRNPKTGLPEYFNISKFFKQAAPVIPALATLIPGVGSAVAGLGTSLGAGTGVWAPVIGSGALGAGIGALTRGGLKGAIEGGLMGGAASALLPVAQNFLSASPQQATVFGFNPAAAAGAGAPAAQGAAQQGAQNVVQKTQTPPQGSVFGWLKENRVPVVLGGGALMLAGGMGSGQKKQPAPVMPAGTPSSFKPVNYRVENRPVNNAATDWYSYGMRPQTDAQNPMFVDRNVVMAADGGAISGDDVESLMARLGGGGEMQEHRGGEEGNVKGPGTGRSDEIPARLSDGEYVIDAETVALLGDGSSDAGAKRLDQFRENIRAHKGAALARGKISPDAKHPEAYLKGGRT
jgi:hypothetical protein